jgi:hypothetical protein
MKQRLNSQSCRNKITFYRKLAKNLQNPEPNIADENWHPNQQGHWLDNGNYQLSIHLVQRQPRIDHGYPQTWRGSGG